MSNDKVIYLKSLFSKFKPKEKLPEDIKIAMLALGVQVDKEKEAERKSSDVLHEFTSGRKFILNNMDEFLSYVIDTLWYCSGMLVSSNAVIFPSSSGLDVIGTVRTKELKRT